MYLIETNYKKYIKYLILFFVFTLPFLSVINDYDIWYHMVIGRQIFNTFSIPSSEFYIYSLLGQKISFHEWGFGLIYYVIYNFFGYYGMNIFNAIIGGAVLFFLYNAFFVTNENRTLVRIVIALISFFFIKSRIIYRPEDFLFLFLAVEIFFLEKFLVKNDWHCLLPLPFLMLILTNIHPSSIFLIGVFVLYVSQWMYEKIKNKEKKDIVPVLVIFLNSVVMSCLNPYGIRQLLLPVEFFFQNKVLNATQEFMPLIQSDYALSFLLFFIFSFLMLIFKPSRKFVYFSLFLLFGYLSIKFTRNIALFAIVMFVPNVKSLSHFLNKTFKNDLYFKKIIVFSSLVLIILCDFYFVRFLGGFGFGIDQHLFPQKICKFIKNNMPSGNIFNDYSYGGYLGWELYPKNLVAIDGRHYSYDKSWKEYNEIIYMKEGWKNILESNDIKYIVIPTMLWNSEVFPIVNFLYSSNEWNLLLEDNESLLFAKSNISLGKSIKALDKKNIWQHVISISNYFTSPKIKNLNLGIAYLKLHEYKEALGYFKQYRQYSPNDQEINMAIQQLERRGL